MKNRRRLYILLIFILSVGVILIGRLVQVQLIEGRRYQKTLGSIEFLKEDIPAIRGDILDRNGEVLATHRYAYSIYAKPYQIERREEIVGKLSEIFDLDDSEHLKSLLEPQRRFLWLKRRASPEIVDKVKSQDLTGIGLFSEEVRHYPYDELASNLIGYVDFDGKACSGVELSLDGYLRGFPGWRLSFKDALQLGSVPAKKEGVSPTDGMDVSLTIDLNLQKVVEDILESYVKEYEAKDGCVIVMEVDSAEIIALASYPDFNPNHYNLEQEQNFSCTPFNWVYEPGSTMKPLIMAAALQENEVGPYTVIDCSKRLSVDDAVIGDVIPHDDVLSVDQILVKSSNIGISKIAKAMDGSSILLYLQQLGFGSETGVYYPGEVDGTIHRDWVRYGSGRIFNAFGQGIGVTPIQMITAMAVIANGGYWRQPTIVKSIKNEEEEVKLKRKEQYRVFSEEICRTVSMMMEDIVQFGGGKKAQIEGYRVAGKTGTSQKVIEGKVEYSESAVISTFVGFVPVDEPRFITLVIINEPSKGYYGSQVAAPAFAEIMKWILNYYNIPPADGEVISGDEIPQYDEECLIFCDNRDDNLWEYTSPVDRYREDAVDVVPDLVGKTPAYAHNLCKDMGTTLEVRGRGMIVESQSPAPGENLDGDKITIWLTGGDI